MGLQNITVRNIGKRLQLSIGGQLVGIHPIEKTISNGIIPFILSETFTEENAALLYNELGQSLMHIRAELNEQKWESRAYFLNLVKNALLLLYFYT